MATSFSLVQLERFRREAKKLGRKLSISHSAALDRIAMQNGFTNWSLLSKHSGGHASVDAPGSSVHHPGAYRYYLHGDVLDSDPTKCYCARCDVFWPLTHLVPTSYHNDGKDGERFLSSLQSWTRLSADERGSKFRPEDAPNVLEAQARASHAAREAARSPFHLWLDGQRDRNDPVGDVADDILRDAGFPIGATTKRQVEDYLERYGSHVIRAVRQAWKEFEGRAERERTLAEALAAEFNLTLVEGQELADAEPMELNGSSGESLSGYEFDFSRHASPRLAAKLMRKHGSLRLKVDPWFFDGIRSEDFHG